MHSSKIIKQKYNQSLMYSNMHFHSKNSQSFMHSYMHSSKIIKQKKIKFYAFINAFFLKKKQYQKGKNNSCIQACIFIQKIHKTSRIHKCIFQKKKNKIKKTKRNQLIKACIFIQKNSQSFKH